MIKRKKKGKVTNFHEPQIEMNDKIKQIFNYRLQLWIELK